MIFSTNQCEINFGRKGSFESTQVRAYLNLLLLNSLAVTVLLIHLHPSEQTQNSFLLKSCSDLVHSKLNSSEVTEALPLIMTCFILSESVLMFKLKLMLCWWLQLHSSSHLQVRCTMLPALRSTWAVKPWVFPHLSSPGKRFVSLFKKCTLSSLNQVIVGP